MSVLKKKSCVRSLSTVYRQKKNQKLPCFGQLPDQVWTWMGVDAGVGLIGKGVAAESGVGEVATSWHCSLWPKIYPNAVTGTLCCRRGRLSDEMLNRGPDSQWS